MTSAKGAKGRSKKPKETPQELVEVADKAIELALPLPISTNRIWRSRRIGKTPTKNR